MEWNDSLGMRLGSSGNETRASYRVFFFQGSKTELKEFQGYTVRLRVFKSIF